MSDIPPIEPDERTLRGFRQGDMAALASVFELYGPRVFRLARRMMGNQADAEDATQEIFIRAHERAHRFNGRSKLYTWIYRLAVWHCLNKIKERRRRLRLAPAASAGAPSEPATVARSPLESMGDDELSRALDREMRSLPPHYRACLVLREVEGMSYARISELLEIPAGTVMSRLARARRLLRANLRGRRENGPPVGNETDSSVVQTAKECEHDDVS